MFIIYIMNNKQVARLILRSQDSITNTNKYNLTWNNINLRLLLGDMWDKYNLFNLELIEITSGLTVAGIGDNINLNVLLNMNGLPVINGSYDCASNKITSNTIIGTFEFVQGITQFKQYQSNPFTFSKLQEQCNLNIHYTTINNVDPTLAYPLPDVVFLFKISGIRLDSDINMDNRMK